MINPVSTREEDLFADALARPVEGRAAFLEGACRGDAELRAKLETLLAAHESPDSLLCAAPPRELLSEEKPGDTIGPLATGSAKAGRYKLLQKIGEGGCGVVWMAEQEEPVRRRVALKVIKLGMETKTVVARFEAERQALAMMDHPNIAKVYDAGATETGRPYFVMELIRGIPITKYCDENHFTPAARLELFIKVCQAIQHAHQKGVIHRDIKPSNILVTVNDGVPTPKVIDFGIAKATQGRLTDATVFTAFEQFIGTPVYMSPEQAEMSSLDIDTRSDIYSLGVLLYELLAGRPPFDPGKFAQAGVDEMRKQIREVDPARPSARLRTLTEEEQTTIARLRSTAPSELSVVLRGDLDWIIMRCLEKDRTRRYDTANGLALDIQRYLRHEPIAAHPPSTAYLLQKVIRRHRFGFAAATGIVAALFAGLAVALWSLANERAARARAVTAEQEQGRQREVAEQAQANEAALRRDAEAQELAAERRAYAADMNLLQKHLALGNFGRARELLNRHRPADGGRDLRGWEWRYLWQFCQGDPRMTICRLQEYGVRSLSVSADGDWVAAGHSGNGEFVLRNLRTGEELRPRPPRFDAGPVQVAFSPVAPVLAVGGSESPREGVMQHFLTLLNVDSRREEQRISLSGPCRGLSFSRDGDTLVLLVGGPEYAIQRYRVSGLTRLSSYAVENPPSSWSSSSRFAVSADARFAVHHLDEASRFRVVDLHTGRERWTARVADERAAALAFSPDGNVLVTGGAYSDGTIQLWEMASGREAGRLVGHRAWVADLRFLPDGKTLVSASADQTIRFWDVGRQRLLRTVLGHTGEVWQAAALPDSRLVSGGKDGAISVCDIGGAEQSRVKTKFPVAVLAWRFAPGKRGIWTFDTEGNVTEWRDGDPRAGVRLLKIGSVPLNRIGAQFSSDAPLLAIGSKGGVRVWDLERRVLIREIESEGEEFLPACFLRRGERLIVFVPGRHRFHEWDLVSGNELASWAAPHRGFSEALSTSSDDRNALMIGRDGAMLLRDMDTGHLASGKISIGWLASSPPKFSPDGRYFSAASEMGFAKIWQTENRREVGVLGGFLLGVHSVAFSPDGGRLATGSGGVEAIRVWDVESQQSVVTLEATGSVFVRTEFSPDGMMLGSVSAYRRILHLWRAPSWAEIDAAEKAQAASRQRP